MTTQNPISTTSPDTLVPFHEHKNYEDDLIELLNSEWPSSRVVRVRTLSKSCDQLPVALLYLKNMDEHSPQPKLVGHSCICAIPGKPKDCWVQSVIIDHGFRGRGFGKRLMLATERYAIEKYDFHIMYLSTHDKKEFYERLGYEECPPIFNVGANSKLLEDERFKKFVDSIGSATQSTTIRHVTSGVGQQNVDNATVTAVPPPPPPPPPVMANGMTTPQVVFMKKQLQ